MCQSSKGKRSRTAGLSQGDYQAYIRTELREAVQLAHLLRFNHNGHRMSGMPDDRLSLPGTNARAKLSPAASFWLLAIVLAAFFAAASAPSPLYGVYQAMWKFSPITLTAIYAVYALGALVALLTAGRLSDHWGRRPVLVLSLLLEVAGVLTFIAAQQVAMLFAARVLTGAGIAMGAGAGSAWLLDLQPPANPRLGSVVGGIALLAGLGLGAFVSGLLVQFGPDPLHLVFWMLAALYGLALAAMPAMPDRIARSPGSLRSLIPKVGVPPAARPLFAALAPSLIAVWALAALYLALGPSLAISLLGTASPVAGGLVILALMGAGTLASVLAERAEPRSLVTRGSLLLIAGVGITLLAIAIRSIVAFYAGSILAGLGFGPAWSGIFRSLAPLAPPDRRGALVAVIYVVLYIALSVPTILAGIAVTSVGLLTTTYAYGLVVMVLSAVTTVAVWQRVPTANTRT